MDYQETRLDGKEHQPDQRADEIGAFKGFSYRLSQERSCSNVFIENLVKMGNGRCLLARLPAPVDTASRNIPLKDQDFQPPQSRSRATKTCQTTKIRREAEEDSQVPVSTPSSDPVGLLTPGHSKSTLGLDQPLCGMPRVKSLTKPAEIQEDLVQQNLLAAGGVVVMGLGSCASL